MNTIDIVYEKTKLREGRNKIREYMLQLCIFDINSTKELARKIHLPIPLVTAVKKELQKLGVLEKGAGFMFTTAGRAFLYKELGIETLDITRYQKLLSMSVLEIIAMFPQLKDIFDNRPQVDVTLDQAKCTLETAIKRVIFMIQKEILLGDKVACIGDDDGISIVIAQLYTYLFGGEIPLTIYVFDKDARILSYLKKQAKLQHWPIIVVEMDFLTTKNIPYGHQFDTVITDPPYTIEGIQVFMNLAILLIKQQEGCSIYVSFVEKESSFLLLFQEYITNSGILLRLRLVGFNTYEGAGILGGKSDFYHLATTAKTKVTVKPNIESIYTARSKPRKRIYVCQKCNQVYQIDATSPIKTIEELKRKGCKQCGSTTFTLKQKTYERN